MNKTRYSAFTLIEVLIFSAIVSTFFVSAAAITTFLLRSMKVSEHKIIATRYAEELLEWVRAEKEKGRDWGSSFDACYNQSPIITSTTCGNISQLTGTLLGESPNRIFKRSAAEVNLVSVDTDIIQKTINVTVEWMEGTNRHNVSFDTIIGIWER